MQTKEEKYTALPHHEFGFRWTGFYRVAEDDMLVLGPFQGPPACSSESKSEIVVPVRNHGRIVAVLDIDSRELGTFDKTDAKYMEK